MKNQKHTIRKVSFKSSLILFAILSVCLALPSQAGNMVCHVSNSGTGDGSSWTESMDLHSALADVNCSEIWVQSGTYYPTTGTDRFVSFVIDRTLKLYGGFAGNETSLNQRTPGLYPTILSGNIGDENVDSDNTRTVIYIDGTDEMSNITATTEINGFTITKGYTNYGAGIYCDGNGAGNECSPLLQNLTFIGNHAYGGGAIFNNGIIGGNSSPTIINSTFAYNTSELGGPAVYNDAYDGVSSPVFENVTFFSNHSDTLAGVMYTRAFSNGDSRPVFNHATFYLNSSAQSGGVFNIASSGSTSLLLTVTNSIFWGNTADIESPITHPSNVAGSFLDNIIDVDCPLSPVTDCTNTITDDPILSPLGNYGGFTQTILPGMFGSAIDTASTGTCLDTDQRGILRPQNAACDMGAVEFLESDEIIFKDGFEAVTID